jgi:hypothetical protein
MPLWAGFAVPLTRAAGAGEVGTDLGHESLVPTEASPGLAPGRCHTLRTTWRKSAHRSADESSTQADEKSEPTRRHLDHHTNARLRAVPYAAESATQTVGEWSPPERSERHASAHAR